MPKNHPIFITGTDTGVGKTMVTCSLLKQSSTAIALKPVLTGCDIHQPEQDSDLALLQSTMSAAIPTHEMVFFSSKIPCSPNLCNEPNQAALTADNVALFCQNTLNRYPNHTTLIEGIGGWTCPINDTETMADVVTILGCPVLLVVGIRLGCLNHTLLTYDHIKQKGLSLAGWVANCIDPDFCVDQQSQNIAFLKQKIQAPLLGTIPHYTDAREYANNPPDRLLTY